MDLSIVIVTHNSLPQVLRCIESIRDHPCSCSYEVIVVDNASSDGCTESLKENFDDIRVIANTDNKGYSRGVNQGIRFSSGRFILVLNPDIEVGEGSIDGLLEFMKKTPDAGIAGSKLVYPDGTLQYSCRSFYTFGALVLRRSFLGRLFPRAKALREHLMLDYDHLEPRKVDWLIGACMMVRREAVEDVGIMDERFFLYFEDLDWCYRMSKQGWNVYYVPSSVMVHKYERSSARKIMNKPFLFHLLSMLRYYEKWNRVAYFFRKNRNVFKSLGLAVSDLIAVNIAFILAYYLRGLAQPLFVNSLYPLSWYGSFIIFYNIIFFFTFSFLGLYRVHRETPAEKEFFQITKAVFLGLVLLMAATYTSRVRIYSRAVIFGQAIISLGLVALFRQSIRLLHKELVSASFDLKRVLVLGSAEEVSRLASRTGALGIDIVGVVNESDESLGPIDRVEELLDEFRIQEIIVMPSFTESQRLLRTILRLKGKMVQIKVISDLAGVLGSGVSIEEIDGIDLFSLEFGFTMKFERFLKRSLDIFVAILAVPFSLLLVPIIKTLARSRGLKPVVEGRTAFKGEEIQWVGLVDGDGNYRFTLIDYHILACILAGKLSFVGPPPVYGEMYEKDRFLLDTVKPGITGRWRLVRQEVFDEVVDQEISYLRNWSFGNDLLIFLKSFFMLKRAAYPAWFYTKESE